MTFEESAKGSSIIEIKTEWFSLTPARCVRLIIAERAAGWWWLILPVVAGCIASAYDIRWLIVTFLLVLVVYPGIIGFVYFNYALRAEVAASLFPHSVTFSRERITVEYRPRQCAGEDQESASGSNSAKQEIVPDTQSFDLSEIKGAEDRGREIVVHLHGVSPLPLLVPVSAFANKEDVSAVLQLLIDGVYENKQNWHHDTA